MHVVIRTIEHVGFPLKKQLPKTEEEKIFITWIVHCFAETKNCVTGTKEKINQFDLVELLEH